MLNWTCEVPGIRTKYQSCPDGAISCGGFDFNNTLNDCISGEYIISIVGLLIGLVVFAYIVYRYLPKSDEGWKHEV